MKGKIRESMINETMKENYVVKPIGREEGCMTLGSGEIVRIKKTVSERVYND